MIRYNYNKLASVEYYNIMFPIYTSLDRIVAMTLSPTLVHKLEIHCKWNLLMPVGSTSNKECSGFHLLTKGRYLTPWCVLLLNVNSMLKENYTGHTYVSNCSLKQYGILPESAHAIPAFVNLQPDWHKRQR